MRKRLNDFVWGTDLGHTRRYLVLAILHVSLLGIAAVWAGPRLAAWLYPAPPPPPAVCTQASIFVSGTIPSTEIAAAKKWIGEPRANITLQGRIWNPQTNRLELWISDGTTLWQLEILCFDTGPNHVAVFSEFHVTSFQSVLDEQRGYIEEEARTRGKIAPQP